MSREDKLLLLLYTPKCGYCNSDLSDMERLVFDHKTLRVYCNNGCAIWGEAREKGLVK